MTVLVGADLPLAGRDGADGLMAAHGVELALDQANEADPRLQFKFDLRDTARGGFQNPHVDEGTDNVFEPLHGAADVEAFAQKTTVVAVLGPLRSNVASAEMPVSARFGLPLISGSAIANEAGPPTRTFFSIAPTPKLVGFAAAHCARTPLRFRRVFVVDDGTRDGEALVAAFRSAYEPLGFTVGALSIARTDAGAAKLNNAISLARADAVLFASTQPLRAIWLTPRAADRIFTATNGLLLTFGAFDPIASLRADERYVAVRALEPSDSAEGRAFVHAFEQRFHEYPSLDAARFYVATKLLIRAVSVAAVDTSTLPSRSAILERLPEGLNSFLGSERFDAYGNLAREDFLLVSRGRLLARCPALE